MGCSSICTSKTWKPHPCWGEKGSLCFVYSNAEKILTKEATFINKDMPKFFKNTEKFLGTMPRPLSPIFLIDQKSTFAAKEIRRLWIFWHIMIQLQCFASEFYTDMLRQWPGINCGFCFYSNLDLLPFCLVFFTDSFYSLYKFENQKILVLDGPCRLESWQVAHRQGNLGILAWDTLKDKLLQKEAPFLLEMTLLGD